MVEFLKKKYVYKKNSEQYIAKDICLYIYFTSLFPSVFSVSCT